MASEIQRIIGTWGDAASMTVTVDLSPNHYHVRADKEMVFLPLNGYEAVNLLWALRTILQAGANEVDAAFLNSGDWIGQVEMDLARRIEGLGVDHPPNHPWPEQLQEEE